MPFCDIDAVSLRPTLSVLSLLSAATLLVGCEDTPSVPPPQADASHAVVLETYLRALLAEDCVTAQALGTDTFTVGNGELCDAVVVSAFEPIGEPAGPRDGEVTYSTVLTTSGSGDGSIRPGRLTWFYSLAERDGEWRLVGGGSGP